MTDSTQVRPPRRILTDIDPSTWEHPADRAALAALRRVPAFDEVLKKVFGFFGEKPIRLAFQANAVRVSERQFPKVYERYREVLHTLDAPEPYPLFISQTPLVNAGAYGMDKPFIVLNSGSLALLDDEELTFLLGHELGHILSGHVLYRTMTVVLIRLAELGFPIVGLAARAVLLALLEWGRKSELSADRAGLLAVQNPEAALSTMLKLAGGGSREETDLNEFLRQAEVPARRRRCRCGLQGAEPARLDAPVPRAAGGGAEGLDRGGRVRPRPARRVPSPWRGVLAIHRRPRGRDARLRRRSEVNDGPGRGPGGRDGEEDPRRVCRRVQAAVT